MPTMTCQGMSGAAAIAPELTFLAASPTICTACTRANCSLRSVSRSARFRPSTKLIAETMASSMWARRARSSGSKLNLRHLHHVIAEVAAQVFLCAQVDASALEQGRKLKLDLCHREQTRPCCRLELHQEVDIAVGPRGALERRAEEREAP